MAKVNKQEGIFFIIAAIIVLFLAMWNPLISAAFSILILIGSAIWELMKK
jgi:hypothetical protein